MPDPIHDLGAHLECLAWEAATEADTQILAAAAQRVRDCARLVEAAREVLSGLDARIIVAKMTHGEPVPVFGGIAELHAALAAFVPPETEERR